VDVPLACGESDCEDGSGNSLVNTPSKNANNKLKTTGNGSKKPPLSTSPRPNYEGGGSDSLTGSLEDLVSSFDEKLSVCFQDYQEQVDKIAPVQVRSQEEIMNECQVWWTITGNFGNMMPIDWSKSTARAKQLPTLNLCNPRSDNSRHSNKKASAAYAFPHSMPGDFDLVDGLEDEDDLVAADLDMHSLILSSNPQEHAEPLKSADEVIKEIDDIIDAADEEDDLEDATGCLASLTADSSQYELSLGNQGGPQSSNTDPYGQQRSFLPRSRIVYQALKGRKLEELSSTELSQILNDIEILVKDLSEELVNDLGVRDELEYEKELKNTFISLLLSIQSKRRACTSSSGSGGGSDLAPATSGLHQATRSNKGQSGPYKYLTTVIPYQPEKGSPSLRNLQVLVKILKAINEDSPAVPALLTDYILKVLCPS